MAEGVSASEEWDPIERLDYALLMVAVMHQVKARKSLCMLIVTCVPSWACEVLFHSHVDVRRHHSSSHRLFSWAPGGRRLSWPEQGRLDLAHAGAIRDEAWFRWHNRTGRTQRAVEEHA